MFNFAIIIAHKTPLNGEIAHRIAHSRTVALRCDFLLLNPEYYEQF